MTTERGWAKDLLRDAGLKVESADFSSFVTKLMNKVRSDAMFLRSLCQSHVIN